MPEWHNAQLPSFRSLENRPGLIEDILPLSFSGMADVVLRMHIAITMTVLTGDPKFVVA